LLAFPSRRPPKELIPRSFAFWLRSDNVWFMEDVALEARMRGIGDVIASEQPHIICLQEVTATSRAPVPQAASAHADVAVVTHAP
jgi:hypothetical protein